MRYLSPGLFALLASCVFLVGTARSDDDQAKTPEDTFKAFTAAMKKEDVKAAMSHLTRDSQSALIGDTLSFAKLSRDFSSSDQKNGKARLAAIESILKRHKIEEATEKFWKDNNPTTQSLLALGNVVKDKAAPASDFHKVATRVAGSSAFKAFDGAKLNGVKIDGTKATGQVTYPVGKRPTTSDLNLDAPEGNGLSILELALEFTRGFETYCFKLEDGVWKIDVIRTNEEYSRSSPPSPSPQPPSHATLSPQTACYVTKTVRCRLFSCCRLFCR